MALFPFMPSAAYQMVGGKPPEPPKQGGTQQVGARRGFMGAFQRKSLPRTLQIIGATMRDIANPQGQALDQFSENEAEQQRLAAEEMAASRDQKYLDQAISLLPQAQQPWARIAPREAAGAAFSSPPARYGELERIDGRLGQRNEMTNQYEWAPQVMDYGIRMQPGMPVPGAPGYVWGEGGTQRPAQGGLADRRINEQQRSTIARAISALDAGQNIDQAINDAEQLVSGVSTGFVGGVTGGLPGTPAYDLRRAIDTITGNLGFEALQNMRDNSPTGGALGQVAVQELMMLQSVVDSFDNAQSERQLRSALRRARQYVARRGERNRRILEAYQMDGGGQTAPGEAPAEPYVNDAPAPPTQGNGLENLTLEQLEEMLRQARGGR